MSDSQKPKAWLVVGVRASSDSGSMTWPEDFCMHGVFFDEKSADAEVQRLNAEARREAEIPEEEDEEEEEGEDDMYDDDDDRLDGVILYETHPIDMLEDVTKLSTKRRKVVVLDLDVLENEANEISRANGGLESSGGFTPTDVSRSWNGMHAPFTRTVNEPFADAVTEAIGALVDAHLTCSDERDDEDDDEDRDDGFGSSPESG